MIPGRPRNVIKLLGALKCKKWKNMASVFLNVIKLRATDTRTHTPETVTLLRTLKTNGARQQSQSYDKSNNVFINFVTSFLTSSASWSSTNQALTCQPVTMNDVFFVHWGVLFQQGVDVLDDTTLTLLQQRETSKQRGMHTLTWSWISQIRLNILVEWTLASSGLRQNSACPFAWWT